MDRKKKIIKLYYDEKLNIIEIGEKCRVTKQYVSQIIKTDHRYNAEKIIRKEETKIIKKNYISKKVKEIRSIKAQSDGYIKQQHIQATNELSCGRKTISNRAFKNWNSSIYQYDLKRKSYKLKKEINVGADVPRIIKW